jgi:predicted DNA-binding protein (MmcQ/YjbR family)
VSTEQTAAFEACERQDGAERTFPFGPQVTVFKIAGKIFAFVEHERTPVRITLKCDPEHGEMLRTEHPAIDRGYHMDKRHWITITLDAGLPEGLIEELIEDSYDLVAPRRKA